MNAAQEDSTQALSIIVPQTEDQHYTDMGNAKRLVARHGDKIRYVKQWGWMIYDGKRWIRDDKNRVMEFAKDTVTELYREAANQPESIRAGMAEWAVRSESLTRLTSMITLAQSAEGIATTVDQFDSDPWLLNVANGTIDLRITPDHTTPTPRKHRPSDLITRLAPVEYIPGARSDTWERFLMEVFDGDGEVVSFIQRMAGYSLTGVTSEPAFLLAYGAGRNGKSTLMGALRGIMGDYMQDAPDKTFTKKERSGGIPNDVAVLAGARLVSISETGSDETLDLGLIKRATGGDTLTARFLNKEFFSFRPEFKAWMATNNLPAVGENTPAIWARVLLVPFTVSFLGREDTTLADKLQRDASAVLAWAIEGVCMWQKRGLDAPESVKAATQRYREDQDVLAEFFGDKCELGAGKQVAARELYTAYVEWFGFGRGRALGEKEFKSAMAQCGYQRRKTGGKMMYQGIAIRPHEMPGLPATTPMPTRSYPLPTVVHGADMDEEGVAF